MNKNIYRFIFLSLLGLGVMSCNGGKQEDSGKTAKTSLNKRSDSADSAKKEREERAAQWVTSLKLGDEKKTERVEKVIADHLRAVRNWHNSHPYSEVPAGINPRTADKLSELDRRIIAHSAQPDSLHQNFIRGLRKDLNEDQVIEILDSYTVGKVDFTMRGYHAIVPDLTEEEAEHIRGLLEEARERAVDYKNMEEISAIFEIYKTKAEQYLESHGRDWHQLYKDFVKNH